MTAGEGVAGTPSQKPLRHLHPMLARLREARAILFLLALLGLFFALTVLIHTSELQAADVAITRALQRSRSAPLDAAAKVFTVIGGGGVMAALSVGVVAFLLGSGRRWAAFFCALTLLGHPLNLWIKSGVDRPRPGENLVQVLLPAVGTSFPSGHAMSAAMFYGFIAFLAYVFLPRRRTHRLLPAALAVVVLLVSISRVYVGAHWFSDILGGLTAGIFFVLLLAEAYKFLGVKELAQPKACKESPI